MKQNFDEAVRLPKEHGGPLRIQAWPKQPDHPDDGPEWILKLNWGGWKRGVTGVGDGSSFEAALDAAADELLSELKE